MNLQYLIDNDVELNKEVIEFLYKFYIYLMVKNQSIQFRYVTIAEYNEINPHSQHMGWIDNTHLKHYSEDTATDFAMKVVDNFYSPICIKKDVLVDGSHRYYSINKCIEEGLIEDKVIIMAFYVKVKNYKETCIGLANTNSSSEYRNKIDSDLYNDDGTIKEEHVIKRITERLAIIDYSNNDFNHMALLSATISRIVERWNNKNPNDIIEASPFFNDVFEHLDIYMDYMGKELDEI